MWLSPEKTFKKGTFELTEEGKQYAQFKFVEQYQENLLAGIKEKFDSYGLEVILEEGKFVILIQDKDYNHFHDSLFQDFNLKCNGDLTQLEWSYAGIPIVFEELV